MPKTSSTGLLLFVTLLTFSTHAFAQDWKLTWSDDFDGKAGSSVDPRKWTFETGGSGFGNEELQFYTERTANCYLDGKGRLVLKALKEPEQARTCWYGPCQYTSARIITRGKFAQAYGRFEARIAIPKGQGVWPAFWLLGEDIKEKGWPGCGEIDVMENIGREPSVVHGTFHGPGYSGSDGIGLAFDEAKGLPFSSDFHLFAVEWEPNKIRWYVDDKLYETRTPADLPPGTKWVYDHPFYIILNLAIGGAWPGSPDETSKFPQSMTVDYVRVYKRG
jgi:beta-glucanase (GH16 family)